MAKLQDDFKADVSIGEEKATFVLREPTNEEYNEFLRDKNPTLKKGKITDKSDPARVRFFDVLLTEVISLDGRDGQPITPERKGEIPMRWKTGIIFNKFESGSEIEVKN